VVGIVETHGRRETGALLEGLEVVPRRRVEYKGRWLDEMDLDAILKRRPQLVLVDELAHTNAPGTRHPKRYMDVEELLGAGIDVYTTLNIQHVESLNDVVARITRIRVRETVPDDHRPRRRDRTGRPDTRRPDPAPEGGESLRAAAGGTRGPPLFPARQPDGVARAHAAPHGPAHRCADGRLHAGARHRRPLGRERARAGRRQRRPELSGDGSLWPASRRPPARAVDRDPHRDLAHATPLVGGA